MSELKFASIAHDGGPVRPANVYNALYDPINAITQGTNEFSRVGRRIKCKNLQIKMMFNMNIPQGGVSLDRPILINVVVVKYQNTSLLGQDPVVSLAALLQKYQGATIEQEKFNVIGSFDPKNFYILKKKQFWLSPQGEFQDSGVPSCKVLKFNIPWRAELNYPTDGAQFSTDVEKRPLIMVYWEPGLEANNFEVRYYDFCRLSYIDF